MSFITNTGLRSLSYATFAVPEDGAVFKKIPGLNEDGSTGGVEKQVTARVDDTLRMSRLLVGDFRKKDDLVVTDPQTEAVIDVVERNRGTNSRTQAGNKFLANLALINQQATLAKIQKKEFTGLGSTVLDGAKDIAKTVASTLAQVPVAGTGVHFVNGGKVGKEYLKGNGGGVGTFLRNVTGTGGGLQGHERVLSGGPILITPDSIAEEGNTLLSKYKKKIEDKTQRAKPTEIRASDANLRQPYKNRNLQNTAFYTRLSNQNKLGTDVINASRVMPEVNDIRGTDVIPFEFQIFNPDNPGKADYLYFRAYLSQLEDSFTGEWNPTKYIGRAENLYNYTGFNRAFSFGFNLAAHSRRELEPLYEKLNLLVGSTAPSYSDTATFMRGVYVKVSIGDYLDKVPGFFTNINVSWNTNYPWEIGLGKKYEELQIMKVPHLLDISLQFQPVHDFNPSYKEGFIGNLNSIDSRQGVVLAPGLGEFQPALDSTAKDQENKEESERSFIEKLNSKRLKNAKESIVESDTVKTINLDIVKEIGKTSLPLDGSVNSDAPVDPTVISTFDPDSTSPDTGPTPNNAGSIFDVPSSNFA
jgi:hypothetical protein